MLSWTDLNMSSCGGRGRDKTCPVEVPSRTSVAGGVMASPLTAVSPFPSLCVPEMGDQATDVTDCRIRSGRGLLDWVAALPGVMGR
jgi:hypothetical protein